MNYVPFLCTKLFQKRGQYSWSFFQSSYRNDYSFSPETEFRKCIVYIFFLTFQVLLYSWMVYAVCVMSSTMWWVMCWPTLTSTPPTSFCQNSNWGTYFVYLSCIANLNVLLILLVANLQNRALSLHGVVVLQPPGVALQEFCLFSVATLSLGNFQDSNFRFHIKS